MTKKGPHISIAGERLVPRVLDIAAREFAQWPEDVQELTVDLASELFLVRYNPFIDSEQVRSSIDDSFQKARAALSMEYAGILGESIRRFWESYDADQAFKAELTERLLAFLPEKAVSTWPGSLIESSTDSTDFRMELPLLVVAPETTQEIQQVVRLAGEMGFSLIPRGGGTGATGGAIPGHARTVMLSLSKLKKILAIDTERRILCAQAGVITLNAIKAVDQMGLLFTVDPASKAGSSLGGNVAENAGGPFAFEYGTTLDNIFSYRQVMPDGSLIEVKRRDHPWHKILPEEEAIFDIFAEDGTLTESVVLKGGEIRGVGLGKDVTNKVLGGLPGVQKEGVDGVITDACFTLHPKLALSRVLCLEFFGRSMRNAMLVIKDVVGLRNRIREEGDLVKISALEEFGPKYVQAIGYTRKSTQYEGDPISVLILQLDSDSGDALDEAVRAILDMAQAYDGVDIFAARDEREAEVFWEDRHKLSAIAKRTSGFKINEDIVIPTDEIPEFSAYLEELNLQFSARAYRLALQEVYKLPGVGVEESIDAELDYAKQILRGEVTTNDLNDEELDVRIDIFMRELEGRYPAQQAGLRRILENMRATRIIVANHMHAGDGNCHVNIPVNSNDPQMLANAHEAAEKVFKKVLSLGGAVSGEHGIGITKINFLEDAKIKALREYKAKVDPKGIINPGKLTSRELPVEPYTFSFNRLILDLKKTSLPDKERLTQLLTNIQVCTRCGKCKQVCPMYFPERDLLYHPRNKNITLGALIEAVYYSLLHTGQPDKKLLSQLRHLTEHCTGCGKCMGVCPVKINSAETTLYMRAFLEHKRSGGHPVKTHVLRFLTQDPHTRVPLTAKALSLGQRFSEKALGLIPAPWRRRMENPIFSGDTPGLDFKNLAEELKLSKGSVFLPESAEEIRDLPKVVFYFPGCGAGLFSRSIGMGSIYLLLKTGVTVILPAKHLCCGYPLLAQGMEEAYLANLDRNRPEIRSVLRAAARVGYKADTVLTSCGSCREGLQKYGVEHLVESREVRHLDVMQFLVERGLPDLVSRPDSLLYHAACHAEWTGQPPAKAAEIYRKALEGLTGSQVRLSPGCCAESGLGALTSPAIYNKLRARKQEQLSKDFAAYRPDGPVIVGCPSCKVGIQRSLLAMGEEREVLHSVELLARMVGGEHWKREFAECIENAHSRGGVRIVRGLEEA